MRGELHIGLLGDFCLTYKGSQVSTVDTPRLKQLLTYLLLHRDTQLSRRYVAFLFWPESTEKQALTNLRNLLHLLHKALPKAETFLIVDSKTLQWNRKASYVLDVEQFNNSIMKAQNSNQISLKINALRSAIDLYRGDLFPECYQEWIEQHRERLRQSYDSSLRDLIALLEEKREFEDAIGYAKTRILHNRLNESAWRKLMKLYAKNSNWAGVLHTYRECVNVLKKKFDTGPTRKTKELYKDLLKDFKAKAEIVDENTVQIYNDKDSVDSLIEESVLANTVIKEKPEKIQILSGIVNIKKVRPYLLVIFSFAFFLFVTLGYYLLSSSSSEIDSIAVLPLENLSRDANQEYFVDGMTEALTAELGRIEELKVISRTSAMHYKNTDKRLPTIARELNVDALVEGSIRQAGNRVQITLKLIHGATDRQIWSQTYERELQDILALQNEVAHTLAKKLKITLAPEVEKRLANIRPVEPYAYRLYLKGNYQLTNGNEANFRRAIAYYKKALEVDSDYAQPYAGLAMAYIELGSWMSSLNPLDVHDLAKSATMKAIAIDSMLAEGYIALGRVKHLYEWDWEGAEKAFQRGIALKPNATPALLIYANYLISMGRYEEAYSVTQKVLEIDPFEAAAFRSQGWALEHMGQISKSLQLYRKSIELGDEFNGHLLLSEYYLKSGQLYEAAEHAEKAESSLGHSPSPTWMGLIAHHYGMANRRTDANRILDSLKFRAENDYVPPNSFAAAYLGLGQKDQALKFLEKGYRIHDVTSVWHKVRWIWDPLRDEPRFQELLKRMNFPDS